eukprot:scaffold3305_cov328-Pinguiococcus_pyrenoidosus.AAC.9
MMGAGQRPLFAISSKSSYNQPAYRIRELCDAGADLEAVNEKGQTPLLRACLHGSAPHAFVEAGANVNHLDVDNMSAMMLLAAAPLTINRSIEPKVLLEAGADPLLRNADGMTALLIAAGNLRVNFIDQLTAPELGVDTIHAVDHKGMNVLHHLVLSVTRMNRERSATAAMNILVSRGADLEHRMTRGDLTPLELSLEQSSVICTMEQVGMNLTGPLLLDLGAEPVVRKVFRPLLDGAIRNLLGRWRFRNRDGIPSVMPRFFFLQARPWVLAHLGRAELREASEAPTASNPALLVDRLPTGLLSSVLGFLIGQPFRFPRSGA